ncbi:MAG: hypothetical protein JSS98_11040 [Bacteroidetes bacterium]|nr:hypothetical protein [Bacteroidota bacterium]
MENLITNYQILIIHNSQFFSKEFQEKNNENGEQNRPSSEQLTEACWNGLINQALPEIACNLVLAEINEAASFLDLEYGQADSSTEKEFSLNPYMFLQTEERLN